jgi:Na+-driven multidrug efflux pump
MVQGMVGAFGVRLPAAILMSKIAAGSLFWLGMAIPVSTLVQIVMCFAALQHRKRKVARLQGV